MKNFIALLQYLLLGCSFIAALKGATDGNIEMNLAFALLSFNFGLNLINQKQLIREIKNSIKKEIDSHPVNDKLESITHKFFQLKEHSDKIKQVFDKQQKTTESNINHCQEMINKHQEKISTLADNDIIPI